MGDDLATLVQRKRRARPGTMADDLATLVQRQRRARPGTMGDDLATLVQRQHWTWPGTMAEALATWNHAGRGTVADALATTTLDKSWTTPLPGTLANALGVVGKAETITGKSTVAHALERFHGTLAQARAQDARSAAIPVEVEDESRPLGSWLASRPMHIQVGILVGGLYVLDAFSRLVEEATGEDIPDTLQATITLCFAVVGFLLMLMNERNKSDQ